MFWNVQFSFPELPLSRVYSGYNILLYCSFSGMNLLISIVYLITLSWFTSNVANTTIELFWHCLCLCFVMRNIAYVFSLIWSVSLFHQCIPFHMKMRYGWILIINKLLFSLLKIYKSRNQSFVLWRAWNIIKGIARGSWNPIM